MTAAQGGSRPGLGWVILVAALAVPGVLFYNWSSRLKAEHDRALSAKARERVPAGGVFETPPAVGRAPSAVSTSAPAVIAAAPKVPDSVKTAPAPSAPYSAKPAAAAAIVSKAIAAPTAAPAPTAPPSRIGNVAFSSVTAGIELSRDPLISPLDVVRIKEYEAEQERIRSARNHPTPIYVRHAPVRTIEQDVDLEGIVTTPDGRPLAIVNNETLGAGAQFNAPGHSGPVKIVRISSDTVWFVYKNKSFKKVVTTE
jgi:hypothetical protein